GLAVHAAPRGRSRAPDHGGGAGLPVLKRAASRDKIDPGRNPGACCSARSGARNFAAIQAEAQKLIDGPVQYAFVTDGVDGFLFADTNHDGKIDDVVKLAGTTAGLKPTDIVGIG